MVSGLIRYFHHQGYLACAAIDKSASCHTRPNSMPSMRTCTSREIVLLSPVEHDGSFAPQILPSCIKPRKDEISSLLLSLNRMRQSLDHAKEMRKG
jgi:HAMP domain-containing protein